MTEVARDFRKEPTQGEAILWEMLRDRRLDGRKFRRQRPIGPFIVDFLCVEERLIVEVDGGIHRAQQGRDAERQKLLVAAGFRLVRISSEKVENDPLACIEMLRAALTPGPSPACGRGVAKPG